MVSFAGRFYKYDAFGNELTTNANDDNPFRYAGEYFDAETGSYYLRARYYDPATGRFGAEDPIRDGLNYYTYCLGNPIVFIDPTGLDAILQTLNTGIFGGIGGQYYGGNQDWFTESWQRGGGCGPTAAANILAYFAQIDSSRFGALYSLADIDEASYTSHMNEVLGYVTPGYIVNPVVDWYLINSGAPRDYIPIGYWFADDFARDVTRFASDRGVDLTAKYMTRYAYTDSPDMWQIYSTPDLQDVVDFIEKGLNLDSPVAMIQHGSNIENFGLHWVTITSIVQNDAGDHILTVSSWGSSYSLSLNDIWNYEGFLDYLGFVYFE